MNAERRDTPSAEDLALCAHDIRGALTVIAGYTTLLRRDTITARERTAALDGIEHAIERIDRLISEALLGSIERPVGEHELIDVGELAEQAAADARAAYRREIRVTHAGRALVAGDATALARALENLLSNAARYAPEGPIDVTVSVAGPTVAIEVADRGPGISPEDREAAFQPFVRLGQDETVPGTGLGLTVVRSVAERLGGRAAILDRDGGGTVVRVELPVAQGAQEP